LNNDDGTLYAINKLSTGNDVQINNIINHYPQIMEILKNEQADILRK